MTISGTVSATNKALTILWPRFHSGHEGTGSISFNSPGQTFTYTTAGSVEFRVDSDGPVSINENAIDSIRTINNIYII
jgi:hypothetical protein